MRKTPTYRLIEDRLGKDLRRHVSTAWHRGDSWATIARDLHASTGLPVSPETVRLWFPHLKLLREAGMDIVREAEAYRRLPAPARAREIRRAAGISQVRLARELQVNRVTVARWESGSRRPRGAHLVAYVDALARLQAAA